MRLLPKKPGKSGAGNGKPFTQRLQPEIRIGKTPTDQRKTLGNQTFHRIQRLLLFRHRRQNLHDKTGLPPDHLRRNLRHNLIQFLKKSNNTIITAGVKYVNTKKYLVNGGTISVDIHIVYDVWFFI